MVCLAAKPAVDGLKRREAGRAEVLRVQIQSRAGRELGRRYGIDVVPSFVVFDARGRVILRINGAPGAPVALLRRKLDEASRVRG